MGVVGALTGAGLGYPSSLLDGPGRVDVVGPDHHQLGHVQASQRLYVTVIPRARPAKRRGGKQRTRMRERGALIYY